MSKLVIAIVHDTDALPVAEALRGAGFRFTRIPSVGGFLETPNATFLLGVEDDRMDDALATFEGSAVARDVEVPLVLLERLPDWEARTVRHGGATIFIGDLERIVRL